MAEEQKKERREEAERQEITQSHEGFWVLSQIQGEAIQKLLITEKHDVNKLLKDHSASCTEWSESREQRREVKTGLQYSGKRHSS